MLFPTNIVQWLRDLSWSTMVIKFVIFLLVPSDKEYSHYVLISYNGYSVKGKNGTSEKIENLIEGFLPIKTLVIVMDNDGGCDDDDSNL